MFIPNTSVPILSARNLLLAYIENQHYLKNQDIEHFGKMFSTRRVSFYKLFPFISRFTLITSSGDPVNDDEFDRVRDRVFSNSLVNISLILQQ